jgi:hypothetical protein
MQARMTTAIDEMRLGIQQLETETQQNQAVYDDLEQEMRAKLEQRISEVKDGDNI